jgi:hypothetical protein
MGANSADRVPGDEPVAWRRRPKFPPTMAPRGCGRRMFVIRVGAGSGLQLTGQLERIIN